MEIVACLVALVFFAFGIDYGVDASRPGAAGTILFLGWTGPYVWLMTFAVLFVAYGLIVAARTQRHSPGVSLPPSPVHSFAIVLFPS